jgi:hypothetical protein
LRAVRSINSVAAKMRASLMVEAELLVEGQVVLDRDGCDVYLALAASSRTPAPAAEAAAQAGAGRAARPVR